MFIKDKIIKLLGGITPTEYKNLQSDVDYYKDQYELYKTQYDKTLKLYKEETGKLRDQIKELEAASNIVTLSVENLNKDDKVIVNGQELKSDSIKLLKGTPIEIAIYDKDDKLYPSLNLIDTEVDE